MRIVIDMQGAQGSNQQRGIGRYTMSLALAIVRNRGEHEIFLALNGDLPASIERIRASFEGLLPQSNIRVWNALPPTTFTQPENEWRRQSGELVREAFLASLNPSFVIISSLFEGLGDEAVTSLKRFSNDCLTAVILYDLIPFIYRHPYLENPMVEAWYLEKIEHLRCVDLCLAISESSSQEAVDHLGFPSSRCVNISTDADSHFQKMTVPTEAAGYLRNQYGLTRDFVMYTGGIDYRKNIEGLIRAYAKISPQLRATHQLAIVCSVQDDSRRRLLALASGEGLNADEVILTGFVPEEDLVNLYNLCAVFVFPSWHEGFGLPALEAMRCGAPVIAANTSSLPEVVGWKEALFDPRADEAITRSIERALTDQEFRAQLVSHGKTQSTKFSWDETARRAIDAMSRLFVEKNGHRVSNALPQNRPKLAYVSPLPPERSGISDYSAELLPALSQHYEIEVVVAQDSVIDTWITANCPIRSVQWFIANSDRFDRVLYHVGNSAFHQHMFELLESIPGVVVLHDFYLSGLRHHMDALQYAPGCFTEQLYRSHGYIGLFDRARAKDVSDVIWKYPCNHDVLENSIGMIAHSEYAIRLAQRWYGDQGAKWVTIPLMRIPAEKDDSAEARNALGLPLNGFVVCSFGMLGPTKLNHRLLNAWLDSDLAKSEDARLVFVGENHAGDYGRELLSLIKRHPKGSTVRITGWSDHDTFRKYLTAADLGVQLRTLSRGETSGTVLDCMNYGLASIVNANGSMADLSDEVVWKLPDEFDDQTLIDALETLWRDRARRDLIGGNARRAILENHDPVRCAYQYQSAIEGFYSKNPSTLRNLLGSIGALSTAPGSDNELISLANSIATTFPPARSGKTLFIDISELVQHDAKTGIQRVVRSVMRNWLLNPPLGWRIEPVYGKLKEPYRYARQFTTGFLEIPFTGLVDEPADFLPGDIFFGLDLQPQAQAEKATFYQKLRQQGVAVKFLVYDLLCILQPENFPHGAGEGFSKWLQVVGESDGAICISQAVADELHDWMMDREWERLRPFEIYSNPLGADVNGSAPTLGLPPDANALLKTLTQRPSFLMVGTLEPRKGHMQVLDALEHLWQSGTQINLVIVGKQGWMVERLVEQLRTHPEFEKRLFWLEGISDEYLEKIYAVSICLIAASYGEGFGLPLIEAAQHKLAIIARDIPVFREVAGEHAYYFNGIKPEALAESVHTWLDLYKRGQHPNSGGIKWLTWQESAALLLEKVLISPDLTSEQRGIAKSLACVVS